MTAGGVDTPLLAVTVTLCHAAWPRTLRTHSGGTARVRTGGNLTIYSRCGHKHPTDHSFYQLPPLLQPILHDLSGYFLSIYYWGLGPVLIPRVTIPELNIKLTPSDLVLIQRFYFIVLPRFLEGEDIAAMRRVSGQSSGSRFIIKSVNMPHFQINGAEGKQNTTSTLLQSPDVRTRSSDHKMQCSVLRHVESTPRCLRYVPTYRGE